MNSRIIAFAGALVLAGCTTKENSALTIDRVVLGELTTVGGASICTFSASSPEESFPQLDPGVPGSRGMAGFVVNNRLTDPTTTNTVLRTDSTTFTPHQAVVDYELVGGGGSIAEQIIPVSGGTVLGGTLTPVQVPLFSPTAALTAVSAFTGFVRTTVRIEGKLDDGSTASTSAHDFVVSIAPGRGTSTCF